MEQILDHYDCAYCGLPTSDGPEPAPGECSCEDYTGQGADLVGALTELLLDFWDLPTLRAPVLDAIRAIAGSDHAAYVDAWTLRGAEHRRLRSGKG